MARTEQRVTRPVAVVVPAVANQLPQPGAEAAVGNILALRAVAALMLARGTGCGGSTWKAEPGADGERCTTCGAWSPCSSPLGDEWTEAR